MKRAAALAGAAVSAALLLSGCGPAEAETSTRTITPESVDGISVIEVDRLNGGKVECVLFDGYKAGGIDCNWEVQRS